MNCDLTIGEKIIIARIRSGFGRKWLGNEVYIKRKIKPSLDFPDGRLKKIELGIIPIKNLIDGEIEAIADALAYDLSFFTECSTIIEQPILSLDDIFAERFPEMIKYFKLLNDTIRFDAKICADIFKRISELVIAA